MTVELVTIRDVELAAVGDWPTEKGWGRFTADDLAAMAVHAARTEGFTPRIKLGHGASGIGAVPAWGRVENVRVEGDKLLGDLTHVPSTLAAVMPSALPGRSIEAVRGRKDTDGSTIPMVMTGLALLGVEEPAISSLADLHAVMVGETDLVIHAAASLAGLTVDEFQQRHLGVVDSRGETTTNSTKDTRVSDDTKKADEKAAADKAAEEKAAADAAATKAADEKAAKDAEAKKADDEAKAAEAAKADEKAVKLPEGVVPIDAKVLKQMQDQIASLTASHEEQVAASRTSYIEDAIGAGKFAPAQRDQYTALLDAAPDATKALIDAMPTQVVPVHAERGHQGDADGVSSDELTPDELAAYEARYGKNEA